MKCHITVKDLSVHRTGLPRHDYSWFFFNTDSRDSSSAHTIHEPSLVCASNGNTNNFMFLAQVVCGKNQARVGSKNINRKVSTRWHDNFEFTLLIGEER